MITLEDLMNVLKDEDGRPITKFELQDLEGNTVYGSELLFLEFHRLASWLVDKVLIKEDGSLTIILNGGDFKSFHIKNVF